MHDPSAWEIVGSAIVNSNDPGVVDPGVALFDSTAICARSELRQTLAMPERALSDPLVVQVFYGYGTGADPNFAPGIAVGFGDHMRELPLGNFVPGGPIDPHPLRFCLPDPGYGPDVELRLMALPPDGGTCSGESLTIDRVEIVPADAGECPDTDTVRDFSFDDTTGVSWSLWASTVGATAEIASDVDGHHLHLATTTYCQRAHAIGLGIWPTQTTIASPALELAWTGTAGAVLTISDEIRTFGQLVGTGTQRTSHVCLPPWAQGTSTPLRFALASPSDTCANAAVFDFTVDDVVMVNEPACGSDRYLLDGGFELATTTAIPPPWRLSVTNADGVAEELDDTASAHTGNGSLHLGATKNCVTASASQSFVVPGADETGGPAITYFYRTEGAGAATAHVLGEALPASATWQEKVICLSGAPGLSSTFNVILTSSGGCATSIDEHLYIDDVTVDTDSSCPAP
jgi:hypothetical protein